MLDKLNKDVFSQCLHQKFLIHVADSEPLETELVEVRALIAPDDAPDRRQPFSLVFRGPAELSLEQGVFHLENETLGELDLFLVTIGPDQEGLRHEANYN